LERALAIREKVLGPEHPDTARSLNNLAFIYDATGAYAKAEPLYQRALAIREKMLGREHTAVPLSNLASLYRAIGADAKAEPLYQRVRVIYERAFGSEHPDTANSLINLALLYDATGAYAKAEPLLERAQGIYEINTARFLLSGDEARKRAYLRRRLSRRAERSSKHLLQEKLIEPLQSSLSGVNRLLLSPDGALNLVPFAALMDERGEYVAQRFELTYLTSGRDLLSLAVPAPARGRPVVMADPAYDQSTSGGPPLDLPRSVDLDRSGLRFYPLAGAANTFRLLIEGRTR
jgi:tetratricopeptide (TPR) repeat protein